MLLPLDSEYIGQLFLLGKAIIDIRTNDINISSKSLSIGRFKRA